MGIGRLFDGGFDSSSLNGHQTFVVVVIVASAQSVVAVVNVEITTRAAQVCMRPSVVVYLCHCKSRTFAMKKYLRDA